MWLSRVLLGPQTWAGPQYDREYVAARTFSLDTAQRAAEAMVAPLRESDDDARDLQPLWIIGSGGDQREVEPVELVSSAPSDLDEILVNGYGALLQIGRVAPAMIYFGDDDARSRALAALGVLEREGRLRVWTPRTRAATWAAGLFALAVCLVVVEFVGNAGWVAWAAACLAAVSGVIQLVVLLREQGANPAPSLPHKLVLAGHPKRS